MTGYCPADRNHYTTDELLTAERNHYMAKMPGTPTIRESILACVGRTPGLLLWQIVERMGRKRDGVWIAMGKLEAEGLVERRPVTGDHINVGKVGYYLKGKE